METPNKKQFYFNGINSDVIIYNNDNSHKINIADIVKNYECVLEREFVMGDSKIKKYKITDELYIDSLNAEGEMSTSKIDCLMHKEGVSDNAVYDVEYNNDKCLVSNLAIYDKKKSKIIISPLENVEQKFIVQNVGKFFQNTITEINNIELNIMSGFLAAYWLLRGGFNKLEKDSEDSFICFKGKEPDSDFITTVLNHIFPNSTTFRKKNNYKDFEFLILVHNEFQDFIINKFGSKHITPWVLQACDDFIKGMLFAFIYCRSYISKDKNNNSYLVISNKNKTLLEELQFILKNKFSLNSKFISTNDSLSFKINDKLMDFLKVGVEEKLFAIDFEDVSITKTKEFYIKGSNNFKIIPWYKIKVNKNEEVENTYTLKLNNSKVFMISNGLFVLS